MSELFIQTQSTINIKDINYFKKIVYNKLQNHFIIIGYGKSFRVTTIFILNHDFTYLTSILPNDYYVSIHINYQLNEIMIVSDKIIYFVQLDNYTLRERVNYDDSIFILGYMDNDIVGINAEHILLRIDHNMNIIKQSRGDIRIRQDLIDAKWNPSMRELIATTFTTIIIYNDELRAKQSFRYKKGPVSPENHNSFLDIDVHTGYIYIVFKIRESNDDDIYIYNLIVMRPTDGSIVSTRTFPSAVRLNSIQVVPEQNKIYLSSHVKIIYMFDMIPDRIREYDEYNESDEDEENDGDDGN